MKSAYSDQTAKGRILVIASSQFPINPFVRAGKSNEPGASSRMFGSQPGGDAVLLSIGQTYAQQTLTSTILAFKNALDWSVASEAIVLCTLLAADDK